MNVVDKQISDTVNKIFIVYIKENKNDVASPEAFEVDL